MAYGAVSGDSFATVGPGTYNLSVLARNLCGSGPETPSQTVTIP